METGWGSGDVRLATEDDEGVDSIFIRRAAPRIQ